ncbi:U4/U6 small nuclear ribonucleoprotein prp4 [Borealophlyctis nickersoniae]|nr:U4/U6 small nuclear ribonucleoprotein prp4 [Borealophlyctis nickersoniae]
MTVGTQSPPSEGEIVEDGEIVDAGHSEQEGNTSPAVGHKRKSSPADSDGINGAQSSSPPPKIRRLDHEGEVVERSFSEGAEIKNDVITKKAANPPNIGTDPDQRVAKVAVTATETSPKTGQRIRIVAIAPEVAPVTDPEVVRGWIDTKATGVIIKGPPHDLRPKETAHPFLRPNATVHGTAHEMLPLQSAVAQVSPRKRRGPDAKREMYAPDHRAPDMARRMTPQDWRSGHPFDAGYPDRHGPPPHFYGGPHGNGQRYDNVRDGRGGGGYGKGYGGYDPRDRPSPYREMDARRMSFEYERRRSIELERRDSFHRGGDGFGAERGRDMRGPNGEPDGYWRNRTGSPGHRPDMNGMDASRSPRHEINATPKGPEKVNEGGDNQQVEKQGQAEDDVPVEVLLGIDEEEKLIEERRKRRKAILQKFSATGASPSTPGPTSEKSSPERAPALTKPTESPAPGQPLRSASQTPGLQTPGPESPFSLGKSVEEAEAVTTAEVSAAAADADMFAADYDPSADTLADEVKLAQRQLGKAGKDELLHAKDALDRSNANGAEDVSAADYREIAGTSVDVAGTVGGGRAEGGKEKEDMFAEDDMFASDDMFAEEGNFAHAKNTKILDSAPVMRASDNPALTDNWDDHEQYYRIILGEVLDDRYHVYSNLGKGVFSSVVKAKDTKNGDTDVAIKIIRNNDIMYRAGVKELSILRKLMAADPDNKKHVIRLIRHFEHKNHLCLVFESLSMNLREVLKKFGRGVGLNIKAVRVYAQQLFLALSLLKKCNILHADIKPDNILVTETKSTLKLCDLGSASDANENEITPYLVSRFYRAPEIVLGMPYDSALDIWSVACTLYELYTGRILFPGRTNNQMLKLHMELKGKFPNKQLRKGQFTSHHFDENFNFLQVETDRVSGKDVIRKVTITKPTSDLRSRLLPTSSTSAEETALVTQFIDLLEKCTQLNPERRMTVKEALVHPFIHAGGH